MSPEPSEKDDSNLVNSSLPHRSSTQASTPYLDSPKPMIGENLVDSSDISPIANIPEVGLGSF